MVPATLRRPALFAAKTSITVLQFLLRANRVVQEGPPPSLPGMLGTIGQGLSRFRLVLDGQNACTFWAAGAIVDCRP
jgi:hypothetical protein